MSSILGAGLACLGLLVFFVMLYVVRRSDSPDWAKSRWVRELTVFTSMILLVGGLGLVAHQLTARSEPSIEIAELLVIAIGVLATILIAWKIRLPVPPGELPPVQGFDPSTISPRNPTPIRPSGRKAA